MWIRSQGVAYLGGSGSLRKCRQTSLGLQKSQARLGLENLLPSSLMLLAGFSFRLAVGQRLSSSTSRTLHRACCVEILTHFCFFLFETDWLGTQSSCLFPLRVSLHCQYWGIQFLWKPELWSPEFPPLSTIMSSETWHALYHSAHY